MSRLCVKNLPKYVNEDRIRDFFSQKGEITDAKLMRTSDGKSRQFAFIGFRTEKEAEEALKFFNNSYMDTSRITCEVARKVGDPNIPRPWSRYSVKEESSLNENRKELAGGGCQNLPKGLETATNDSKKSEDNKNNDPQLQEFLKVMQPRARSKIWADDAITGPQHDQEGKKEEEAQTLKANKKQNNKENKLTDKTSSSPTPEGCSETISMKKDDTACAVDISDMDHFKSRVKKSWSDSESDDEGSHDVGLDSIKTRSADLKSKDHAVEMEEASVKGSDVE